MFTLIIIGIIALGLGIWLGSRSASLGGMQGEQGSQGEGKESLNLQSKEKEERKEKILESFRQGQSKMTNNDVEALLGVSDSTAERYLNELEREGKLTQHGLTGRGIFYTLN